MSDKLMRTTLSTSILLALLFVAASNAFGQFDPSALYQITAKHSGKCLTVSGGNAFVNNAVPVRQSDCRDTENNQKWQVLPVGFGFFKIIARHSGKALELRGGVGATGNGVATQQWDYVGAANQKWWLNPVGDGFYQIVAAHSRRSLDVNGGSTDNEAQVQQWDYWGGDNQKWKFTLVPASQAGDILTEAEACKNTLQSGTISWGGGTTWAPANIDRLCYGTRNARNTIFCFQSNVGAHGWPTAIERCRVR
jgi:hypothetical protein